MSLKDYIREPKKDWTDKQWLQYAYVQVHNPWINEDEREYFRDMIKRLSNTQFSTGQYVETVENSKNKYILP